MNEVEETDPDLDVIRARRLEELLDGRRAGARVETPRGVPRELTAATVDPFLSEHPHAVIDVWAPWCGPCRTMAPVLEALAQELAPDVHFGKVNADADPAWAARWKVEGIPTLLLFEQGRLADRVVGVAPAGALRHRLRSLYRLGRPAEHGIQ